MASAPPTLAELLDGVSGLLGRRNLSQVEYQNWAGGSAVGGPANDGRYPITDGTGFVRMLPSPAAAVAAAAPVGPLNFGAIGDGLSHPASLTFATLADCQVVYPFATSLAQEMDFLAHQKMVNTPRANSYYSDKRTFKMSNANPDSQVPLSWIAGFCDYDAGYSEFDWSESQVKTNSTHLVADYDFATPDTWANATDYTPDQIIFAAFGGGAAVCTDNRDGTVAGVNPYYEFSHAVHVPKGRWRCVFSGTAKRGVSYDHGNGNLPYAAVTFSGGGIFQVGSAYVGLDKIDPVNVAVPFSAKFDFELDADADGVVTFHGGGYVNFRVTQIDVIPWPAPYAIVNTRDGAPDHYFLPRRFKNAQLLGPGTASGMYCAVWQSFSSYDGDLQDWEAIDVRNWYGPIEWSDGAYLITYYDIRFLFNGAGGVFFDSGRINAGENIRFYGGTISGNDVAFRNPGAAEITCFGTVPDYGVQICQDNVGQIRFIGSRHEQNHNDGRRIWHCRDGGRVIYIGGFVLLAGNAGQLAPADLEGSLCSVEFHATQVYNARSNEGVMAIGPGRVVFKGHQSNGNPNIGPNLITEAPVMDMLGGAGTFDPIFTNWPTDPSGISLQGGVFPAAGQVNTDRWTAPTMIVSKSTAYAFDGTTSMQVQKIGRADNQVNNALHLLIPMPEEGNILGTLNFLFPTPVVWDPAPAQAPILYIRYWWAQVIGQDALGKPIYGGQSLFAGELDIFIPIAGSPDWINRNINTMYANPSTDPLQQSSDRSPSWATHFLILIETSDVPDITFYIDGFRANFIG